MTRVKWSRQRWTPDDPYAVFAVDPGGTSGWARSVIMPHDTLAATLRAGTVEAGEFRGETLDQCFELTNEFIAWRERVTKTGTIKKVYLVFESFELRQQNADLSSVEVIHGSRCLLATEGIEVDKTCFQMPGDAKYLGSVKRLKHWGLYAAGRGSDHKRDATRHLALCVNRIMDGDSVKWT